MIFCSIFLGLTRNDGETLNSWKHRYQIEHVRQPEERIALYATGKLEGKYDIALIRLTEEVTFIPHQLSPVCRIFLFKIF